MIRTGILAVCLCLFAAKVVEGGYLKVGELQILTGTVSADDVTNVRRIPVTFSPIFESTPLVSLTVIRLYVNTYHLNFQYNAIATSISPNGFVVEVSNAGVMTNTAKVNRIEVQYEAKGVAAKSLEAT